MLPLVLLSHRFPPAARHHLGVLAAFPTLDGATRRPRAGAWPAHPSGDARDAAHQWIEAELTPRALEEWLVGLAI